MSIEPVVATEFLPIAWVLVNVFFEALIKVDFSILEPAAIAVPLMTANKVTVANVIVSQFRRKITVNDSRCLCDVFTDLCL